MWEDGLQPVSTTVHAINPSQYPPRVPSEIEGLHLQIRMTVLLVITEHTSLLFIKYHQTYLFC